MEVRGKIHHILQAANAYDHAAGKSTLLQILAGKRLISTAGTDVRIKGRDVFRNTPLGITFLGTEWCVICPCWQTRNSRAHLMCITQGDEPRRARGHCGF